jgi:hypothetical protein
VVGRPRGGASKIRAFNFVHLMPSIDGMDFFQYMFRFSLAYFGA